MPLEFSVLPRPLAGRAIHRRKAPEAALRYGNSVEIVSQSV